MKKRKKPKHIKLFKQEMEIKIHNIGDNIGPEKILLLRQPRIGMEAIVVIDNVACGPAIGGVRMAHRI